MFRLIRILLVITGIYFLAKIIFRQIKNIISPSGSVRKETHAPDKIENVPYEEIK